MRSSILGRPEAVYDPFGTTIRISYDPEFDLLDNPAVSHELTHFGQNILTALGINQTLMYNELYYSTCQILLSNIQIKLPLAQHKFKKRLIFSKKPIFWEHGELAIQFQKDVIGGPFIDKFDDFVLALEEIRSDLLESTYKPGSPNPFYFEFKWRGPGFGLKFKESVDWFFRLDGHFIQEIHARSTEFITRWSQEQLSIDDAVTYFLHSLNNPYTLLYLAVSKLITERTGQVFFDVQDSVFLCHLCSLIALTYVEMDNTHNFVEREIRTTRIRFRYIAPGEIFLHALSAALDQFVRPSWAINSYFDLMEAIITKLNWPKFERTMNDTIALVNRLQEGYIQNTKNDQGRGYNAYLLEKWQSSEKAIKWFVKQYQERKLMEFIRAPILIVHDGIVRGPLIASPSNLSILLRHGDTGKNGTPPEMIQGMLVAFITSKLWFGSDLTCLEPKDSPLAGSVIGCEDAYRCGNELEINKQCPICNNYAWLTCLKNYPGLSSRIDNLKLQKGKKSQ